MRVICRMFDNHQVRPSPPASAAGAGRLRRSARGTARKNANHKLGIE